MLGSTPALLASSSFIGAGTAITAIYFQTDPDVSRIGLFVALAGVCVLIGAQLVRAIQRVNRPADAAFTEGYEMGYAAGYREGRRTDRPTVVTMPSAHAAGDVS